MVKRVRPADKRLSRVQFTGVNEDEEEKSPPAFSRGQHPIISKSVTSLRDY